MKTIEIGNFEFEELFNMAEKLHIEISEVVEQLVNGYLDECFEEDIRKQEEIEMKREWEIDNQDLYLFL